MKSIFILTLLLVAACNTVPMIWVKTNGTEKQKADDYNACQFEMDKVQQTNPFANVSVIENSCMTMKGYHRERAWQD